MMNDSHVALCYDGFSEKPKSNQLDSVSTLRVAVTDVYLFIFIISLKNIQHIITIIVSK